MFGFLCPIAGSVSPADAEAWGAHEAAVAAALRSGYGADAAALASPDAAFISLLTAAQRAGRRRPGRRDPGVQLAAAAAVALAYRKVEDDLTDEPSGRLRLVERWLRPKRRRARHVAAALDFDLAETDGAFADQVAVEKDNTGPLATMARATGRGMAALLAHTASLAGAPQNEEPLRGLGAALGELIFVVDAAADLIYDSAARLSNPLIDPRRPGRIPEPEDAAAARAAAAAFARRRLETMADRLTPVSLARHRALVSHILTEAVPERVARIVSAQPAGVVGFRYERTLPGRVIGAVLRNG